MYALPHSLLILLRKQKTEDHVITSVKPNSDTSCNASGGLSPEGGVVRIPYFRPLTSFFSDFIRLSDLKLNR